MNLGDLIRLAHVVGLLKTQGPPEIDFSISKDTGEVSLPLPNVSPVKTPSKLLSMMFPRVKGYRSDSPYYWSTADYTFSNDYWSSSNFYTSYNPFTRERVTTRLVTGETVLPSTITTSGTESEVTTPAIVSSTTTASSISPEPTSVSPKTVHYKEINIIFGNNVFINNHGVVVH